MPTSIQPGLVPLAQLTQHIRPSYSAPLQRVLAASIIPQLLRNIANTRLMVLEKPVTRSLRLTVQAISRAAISDLPGSVDGATLLPVSAAARAPESAADVVEFTAALTLM